MYLLLCIVPPSTEGVISHIFETDLFQFLHNVILSLIKKIGLFSYLIPIPQALTSFSPIRARAFLKILFTFFIISLSFLFMFYNTKLYCFVLDCTLIKIKGMRKWQFLTCIKNLPFLIKKLFQKPSFLNSFSKLGVNISFPILLLISSSDQKRPPSSSSLGIMGPS